MSYNTHIICSKEKIRDTFCWEKIFSDSDDIQRSLTNPSVWEIKGLCSFALTPDGITCHPTPDDKILHTLEKNISDYYGCETKVSFQEQMYFVTLSDDAHEKVDLTNTVKFGRWPQNGITMEPIEWLVLDDTGKEMLLLCKYSIATKGFIFDYGHDSFEYRKCLWEYSDLRRWLHEEFYSAAFDEHEKAMILPTEIKSLCNDTESLDIFENRVFLLSREQVESYLTTPELRKGVRTVNAAEDPNVLPSDRTKLDNIPWWILPHIQRGGYGVSAGKDKDKRFSYVAYPQMAFDQGTQYHGRNVYHKDWSVRPAIRIRKINKAGTEGMKLMCGGKVVTNEQVPAAIEEYEQKIKSPNFKKEIEKYKEFSQGTRKNKIRWQIGDITEFKGECVVNAANSSLLGGSGVDGAIHRAAGPDLLAACRKIGGCKTGEAKLTPGFGLKAKYIIHTVGPVYPKHPSYENIQTCEKQLGSCYANAMDLAKEHNIKTIAFPAISTGAYGYPKEDAALIALDTVAEWMRCNNYQIDVCFYCYNETMLQIYEQANQKQKKRYEYRILPKSDKIYKLDHIYSQAYTLNAEKIWEPTINGVYQDLAHGHIGSEVVYFDDIYPMHR